MSSVQHILTVLAVFLQFQYYANAAGYHYERPLTDPINIVTGASISVSGFGDLPTAHPLPAVPSLPPLPTPRSKTQQQQSLVQVHPPSASAINNAAPQKSIASLYRPSNYLPPPTQTIPSAPSQSAISHISQSYQLAQQQLQQQQQRIQQQQAQPQPRQQIFGQRLSSVQRPQSTINFAPQISVPAPSAAPLSDPNAFEQKIYTANGRQLKQYAVVEIIDNDIEPIPQPFLTPFFDSFRAHFGASGTGATPFGGQQINSRADNSILDQQRQLLTQTPTAGDAIALGSGGLGFIRLNGNVYLGSGSLGYVSGQQRNEFLRNARTRSGASVPDALHFGHGPLGGSGNFLRK